MEQQIGFDFNEVLEQFKSGKNLTGKDGLLAPLIKQLTEAALEAEVESHIANDVLNGNRNGTFKPQIVKKYQTTISNEIEEKILSMYGLGMSYTDISAHISQKP